MFTTKYNQDFQIRLLTCLYHCPKFFMEVNDWFRLTDWSLSGCRLLFEVLRVHYAKYKTLPSWAITEREIMLALATPGRYESIVQPPEFESMVTIMGMVARGNAQAAAGEADYYRDELKSFFRHTRLAQADQDGSSDADQRIIHALKIEDDIQRMGVGGQDPYTLTNAMETISDEVATGLRIGTGVYKIDRHINHGLAPGMLGMVVACTGVGKTCGLINFAVNAAFLDTFSLFLTLELPRVRIMQRIQAMMACVDAKWFSLPKSAWPAAVKFRVETACSTSFRYGFNITVGDMSDRAPTVADIERMIVKWRARMTKLGVPESRCLLVFVDWLERMSHEGLKNVNKSTNDAKILQLLLEALGEVARRHNVVLWTAVQATRDAMGKEVLDIKHTAHSIHVHDPLDLSIGIAPKEVLDDTGRDPAKLTDDDSWDATSTAPSKACDRELNVSFLKSRYSAVAGMYTTIYQGPTLRLWDDKGRSITAAQHAASGNLEAMYTSMGALSYNL